MILPEWLFKEPIENKIKKIYNPKSLKQIDRDNNKLDDKQLNKELAKTNNPYYSTDRALRVGFTITLESHHINHAISKLINKPNYPEFGIEVGYNNKMIKELSVFYARIINQYNIKYQTVLSARFDKQDEDNQLLDETELFVNLKFDHNLTQSDFDKIDARSPLEHHIQQQEMKDSGWRFDKINSMTRFFCQTGIMNGATYNKTPLK